MRTLVLGMGNLVHADDGVGVHAIERLRNHPRVPGDVVLMDGGTQGLSLLAHVSGFERLLVIDAIDAGEIPGTTIRVDGNALSQLPGKASVHQLGFADMMIALKLLGEAPSEIVIIGVQPQSTEWSSTLTEPVQRSLDGLIEIVLRQLEVWANHPLACATTP